MSAADAEADDAPGSNPGVHRRVRTTRRRGRLGAEARRALHDGAPRHAIGQGPSRWWPESLAAAFGRDTSRLLDVGTGTGEATRAWADANPGWDVLAVELHRPGLARLVRDLDSDGPSNIRVVEADAGAVIERGLRVGSVHGVRILFPDPWPKRRHLGRRLVDRTFVARVTSLLPPGGHLHVATDWADYADQIAHAFAADGHLEPVGSAWVTARLPRPVTRYEQRAGDAGRDVIDLLAVRAR